MDALEELWPDPDRRDAALVRALIRIHAQPDDRDVLTERETQVLTALAHGMSGPEAGVLLGMAPDTVRQHSKRIRSVLRAKTTPHAVANAIRQGLIT